MQNIYASNMLGNGKPIPKTIDAIKIGSRYVDKNVVDRKVRRFISASVLAAALAFSFLMTCI